MYLPARAHRCTPTYAYTRQYICSYMSYMCGAQCTSRLFVEQPRIYPLSSAVYTTRSPDNIRKPFFFSHPHLFSILKRLISRSELLWGQIPRSRSVLPAGNFGVNSSRASTGRFDKSRRCCHLLLVERYWSKWHRTPRIKRNRTGSIFLNPSNKRASQVRFYEPIKFK